MEECGKCMGMAVVLRYKRRGKAQIKFANSYVVSQLILALLGLYNSYKTTIKLPKSYCQNVNIILEPFNQGFLILGCYNR